jgi:uncharacterized membrane-anchored protein YhcB (DUF1043 family)
VAAEFWILLIILASAAAAGAGFMYARRGAPSQSEIDSLQQELETARRQATAVQDNVTGHFEQSALLFGRLAHDYRAFLEHFSESAKDLGIDEVKARELLERADLPLLGHNRDVIDAAIDTEAESEIEAPAELEPQATMDPLDQGEPPLIEDIVEPTVKDEAADSVTSTVVDVDLEPKADESSVKAQRTS